MTPDLIEAHSGDRETIYVLLVDEAVECYVAVEARFIAGDVFFIPRQRCREGRVLPGYVACRLTQFPDETLLVVSERLY